LDVWNWALGVAEQHVGVEVVLLRAIGRELRLWGECSMVMRRWRPAVARCRRGARAQGHQGRGKRSEMRGDDAWTCAAAGGGARGPAPAMSDGGRAGQTGKRRWSEEDEAGRSQKDLFVISKKFRDSSVN
jgi:hypothetical protein